MNNLLAIGRFSKITRLTVKALRHYVTESRPRLTIVGRGPKLRMQGGRRSRRRSVHQYVTESRPRTTQQTELSAAL